MTSPHLILHFDINNTIIISDEAGGKSTHDVVNSIIMKTVWGKVLPKVPDHIPQFVPFREQFRWHAFSTEPSIKPPAVGLVTFDEFLENEMFPYPKNLDNYSLDQKSEIKKEIKAKRRQVIHQFCDDGFVGGNHLSLMLIIVSCRTI